MKVEWNHPESQTYLGLHAVPTCALQDLGDVLLGNISECVKAWSGHEELYSFMINNHQHTLTWGVSPKMAYDFVCWLDCVLSSGVAGWFSFCSSTVVK